MLAVLTCFNIDIEMWYLLAAVTDTITALILLVPISLTEGISLKRLWQL
ncbi:MAG: hypothetical protein ACFE95_09585 [Candidatus Hodarchaeota archaeon]